MKLFGLDQPRVTLIIATPAAMEDETGQPGLFEQLSYAYIPMDQERNCNKTARLEEYI